MRLAEVCGYCKEHELEEVSINRDAGVFLMCPNCDSPDGIDPEPDDDEEELPELPEGEG